MVEKEMRRKTLILQSVVLLAVALMMLTVAGFAWFMGRSDPSLGSFTVKVKGSISVGTRFYAGAETDGTVTYTEVTPSEMSPFIADETMYPGVSVYRRVDVTNLSDRDGILTVDFTGVSCLYTAAGADRAAEIAVLDAALFIGTHTERGGTEEAERFIHFIAAADGGADTVAVSSAALAAGETVRIYYRFTVEKDFTGETASGSLALSAAEIRFTCE